jgi:hypothetical protein
MAVDVCGGVMTDGDYGLSLTHHLRCLRIRMPACWTEWKELRSVSEIDDVAGGGVMGFPEQDVTDVFRRDQDPIRVELVYVVSQNACVAREFVNGENLNVVDCGWGGVGREAVGNYAALVAVCGQMLQPDQIASRGSAAWGSVGGV